MRKEEAKVIGEIIRDINLATLVNLGSGDVSLLSKKKPWVDEYIFIPVRNRGVAIVHSDFKLFEGVDLVVDLTISEQLKIFEEIPGKRVFLLANVLEHVPNSLRSCFVENIEKLLQPNDELIVSVPFKYPYHADPIDSMFRPSPGDLGRLFNLDVVRSEVVISSTYYNELKTMPLLKACRKLLKPVWPFQKAKKIRESISRLTFLFKPYKVSVVKFARK